MSRKLTVKDWQNRLNQLCQPLVIIDYRITEYNKESYTIQCFKCGCSFEATKSALHSAYLKLKNDAHHGYWCPVCNHKEIVVGYNDLATIRSDLVKYFVNPEEAKQCSVKSGKKVLLICPDCKQTKQIRVSDFSRFGFSCDYCKDNLSIGEKIIRNLMIQLPVSDYRFEFFDAWTQNRRYDVCFIYKDKKYLIEVDGEQHSKDTKWSTKEKQEKNDAFKTQLATQNNYELIRIDAYYSDFNYIKQNIANSRLSEIFDLSDIDWNIIREKTVTSRNIEIAKYYMEHRDVMIKDIAKHFHTDNGTISRTLEKLAEVGLCDYSKRESFLKGRMHSGRNRVKNNDPFILISPNNEQLGVYKSLDECYRTHHVLFENMKMNPQKLKRLAFVGDDFEGYRIEYQIGLYEYHRKNHPIVFEICDLYKQGMNPYEIVDLKHIALSSVYRYLITGVNMGICNYPRKKKMKDKGEKIA